MSSVNILFYSNNCEGCKQLISMMQQEKLVRFFHLICTDNNPNIPPQIKVTPTLIIRGVPTPYIAGDAFAWLAKIKQWKIQMTMKNMSSAQQQYLQSINNNLVADKSNLLGFSQAEMSGMSDIFSFFSKKMDKECQDALPQSFFTCNNMGCENIFTPPLEDGSYKINDCAKYKIDASKQKELQNKLESERKKQEEVFKDNIDSFVKKINSGKETGSF